MTTNIIQVVFKFILLTSTTFFFIGCGANNSEVKPQMSTLQIEQIQSKYYEKNKQDVFSAIISMLQSEGLMIKSADGTLGIISAKGMAKFEGLDLFTFSGGIKSSVLNVMIFVKEIKNNKIKVRINIIKEMIGKTAFGGGSSYEILIKDPQIYRAFFNKIDKNLFIETNIE